MIRSRTARLAVAFAASAALLAGCGQGGAESGGSVDLSSMDPVQGGSLRWGYVFTAPSLDPAQCGTSAGWQACQAIYGTLMSYDASDNSYAPAMAESVVTEDGRVWTLTLREGVTFTDGTPY
ncbi:ABC transporter substrate-binding protein, partial [Rhodococcus chondri]